MNRLISIALSVVLALPVHADVVGRVVSIADGDTVTVLVGREQVPLSKHHWAATAASKTIAIPLK